MDVLLAHGSMEGFFHPLAELFSAIRQAFHGIGYPLRPLGRCRGPIRSEFGSFRRIDREIGCFNARPIYRRHGAIKQT